MKILLSFGFLFLLSYSQISLAQELKQNKKSALAEELAGMELQGKRLDPYVAAEMKEQVKRELDFYHEKGMSNLSEEQKKKFSAALDKYEKHMLQRAEYFSSKDFLQKRLANYYLESFEIKELKKLVKIFSQKEFVKYQQKMTYLELGPDEVLGIRSSFKKEIEVARKQILAASIQ